LRFLPQLPAPEELEIESEDSGEKDPFAVFLLVCVTLSYVLRFSGIAGVDGVLQWLSTPTADGLFPLDGAWWSARFFVVVPGLAAAYSRAGGRNPGADCF